MTKILSVDTLLYICYKQHWDHQLYAFAWNSGWVRSGWWRCLGVLFEILWQRMRLQERVSFRKNFHLKNKSPFVKNKKYYILSNLNSISHYTWSIIVNPALSRQAALSSPRPPSVVPQCHFVAGPNSAFSDFPSRHRDLSIHIERPLPS